MRAVVRLATIGAGLDFGGERDRPLLPDEMSPLRELHSERKRPGIGSHRGNLDCADKQLRKVPHPVPGRYNLIGGLILCDSA
jgi:hypothetical protein